MGSVAVLALPWASTFVLGAILGPTDAIAATAATAATAILRRRG
jgi:NhaP-type Na+/H+ or K+/H+ antiporter